MHQIGDEITRDTKTFVYIGYGKWEEVVNSSRIVNTDGEVVSVKPNIHSGNNELLVNMEGHVCTENSSDTILTADSDFAGAWQDTLDYGNISIGIKADQDSAIDGLIVQWSADGITVHDTDIFSILANVGKNFSFGPARRYIKLIYTNGAVTQSSFNLSTILRRIYVKPSSHRINDNIVGEDDGELIKAVVTGEKQNGVFSNAVLDNASNLRVNAFPYTYAIAEGVITGHTALLKFGTRTTVAQGTSSTVWEGPTALYVYMDTAQKVKAVSTDNVNDNVGGTGALTLFISGLDENWDEVSETITMAGTTPVETTNTYIRVFRAYTVTCGSSHTNTGTISITNNAGTVTQAIINIGDGQTLMTLWTVPLGQTAYVVQGTVSTNSNKGAVVSMFVRLNDGGTDYPWLIKYRSYIFSGNEVFPFVIPFKVPAKTDIEIRVLTPVAAGATSCGSTFELWYE